MDPNALKNAWTQWMSGLAQGGQGPAGQVYREWEQWIGQQFEKLARSESFLGQTAKALEGSFLLKSQFDRMLEGSLKAMRMPSLRLMSMPTACANISARMRLRWVGWM